MQPRRKAFGFLCLQQNRNNRTSGFPLCVQDLALESVEEFFDFYLYSLPKSLAKSVASHCRKEAGEAQSTPRLTSVSGYGSFCRVLSQGLSKSTQKFLSLS